MEMVECGAASLAMVLGYWGRIVPLAQLRRDCAVSRDGSNASNILRAARAYGLKAKGFRKDLNALKDLAYPYIVFWNFNHFLVVEGYRKGMVYVNDPASGPRKVTLEEFDEAYTGVVLVMEPGPDFQPGGAKPSSAASLWRRLRASTGAVSLCALAALLLVIPGLVVPALTQVFVDQVLVQGFRDWARPIILGMLAAALLRAFLTHLQLGLLRRLKTRLSVAMSSRFVWRLLQLPAAYYGQRYAGEISNRIALNDRVADVLSGRLATTVIDLFMMAFYAAVLFQFDRVLTGMGMGFALTHFLVLRGIVRRRLEDTHRLGHAAAKTSGAGVAGLQSIRTLKAAGRESDFFAKWAGHFANLTNTQQELGLSNQYLGVLPPFLTGLMTMLILVAGGLRVMNGALSIGQLIAFHSMMASFLLPVNHLVSLSAVMQELEADLNRLDDALNNVVDPAGGEGPARAGGPAPLPAGRLEFRNVSFGYSPLAPPLIENLSFHLEPGRRLALVGGSGSGKSTVAKLAAGVYQPTSGEILFDGRPRSAIPREVLASSVAMVEQDILMFEGSVADNLTLWDPTAPQSSIAAACRDARIEEVIAGWPRGYQEDLLEGAANMSGGEKQRLEIARALVNNPSLLILDEATSALDAETERIIDQNLRRRGCSCLIVAHRLSTIRDCDEILVLRNGELAQRGRHQELLREGGEYARLLSGDPLEVS
jgi:NHLM bacteriocin system ABC transporter peptidase/ATP-binding protein